MSLLGTLGGWVGDLYGGLTGESPQDTFDTLSGVDAAELQYQAQQDALAAQAAEAQRQRDYLDQQSAAAEGELESGGANARGTLWQGKQDAAALFGQSAGALTGASQQAQQTLAGGNTQARADISGGSAQAGTALSGGYDAAMSGLAGVNAGPISNYDVTGQQSQLAGLMGQGQDLYSQMGRGFDPTADAGYRFRQQQGEQAIGRAAAATGGRTGGAQLKALAQFNQGLASEEADRAFGRQQAQNAQQMAMLGQQYGAAGNVDAMRQAASFNQAGRVDQARQQAAQNQLGLASQMANMSAAKGSQMANLYQSTGDRLGQMSYGYGSEAAGMQNNLGSSLSGLYGQQAGFMGGMDTAMADSYQQQAVAEANAAMGGTTQATSLANQMMQAYANNAQYGGMVAQAQTNGLQGLLGAGLQAYLSS